MGTGSVSVWPKCWSSKHLYTQSKGKREGKEFSDHKCEALLLQKDHTILCISKFCVCVCVCACVCVFKINLRYVADDDNSL